MRIASRILVIDDETGVRTTVAMILGVVEAVAVESGAAGLRELDTSHFDLAIVDIFLQGKMSSIDVIRLQRQCSPSLPVVAASGLVALDFLT